MELDTCFIVRGLVSAPTARAEALGLALARLFLEYHGALRNQPACCTSASRPYSSRTGLSIASNSANDRELMISR